MHAQPLDAQQAQAAVDTELTRAAAGSINNASQITTAEVFEEADFTPAKDEAAAEAKLHAKRKKARKAERQRKKKGRGR